MSDGCGGSADRVVPRPYSDRHHALLAFLRGEDAPLREAAARDAYQTAALREAIDHLARNRIDSLVLKGAAFAQAYPAPFLRPRNDDDLWVRARDFEAACAALGGAGYVAAVEITASDLTRQRHFAAERGSFVHQIDLHWWPVNPSAFDALPDFDACWEAAEPLPDAGPNARAPGRVHALLLACAHRVAHHTETEDAMWLCDLHFLAGRLTPEGWDALERAARAARCARICGAELNRARVALGAPVPAGVIERLSEARGEPTALHWRSLGPLGDLWRELRIRTGVAARARLVAHHVAPPRAYMAAKYGYAGLGWLPLLYAHRLAAGLRGWTAELLARRSRTGANP